MAIARAKLVDLTVTRWYHCVSRCVRKAFLLGEGDQNRKEWLEDRLEELSEIFAVAVGGFSVMDNHLHVLLRLDPEVAHGWSDLEVVQRWGRLFPPRDKSRQPMPLTEEWIQWRLGDAPWIAAELAAAEAGSVAGSLASAGLEESLCQPEGLSVAMISIADRSELPKLDRRARTQKPACTSRTSASKLDPSPLGQNRERRGTNWTCFKG